MNYKISHKTEYVHQEPVFLCHNLARLFPRNTENQACRKTFIQIDPEPSIYTEYTDFFGNKVVYFAIQHEHSKLTVNVISEIEKIKPVFLEIDLYGHSTCEEVKQQLMQPMASLAEARQYISETSITQSSPEILHYAQQTFFPTRPVFEAAHELMERIHADFEFEPGFTTTATSVSQVMRQRKGVCQDFAHIAIACLRSVGLPARYVSGYIETLPPNGADKLVGADASHAWYSVFIPHLGWIDFDPTNNQTPSDQHITIGWGRDYADITPLKGIILSSGNHQLNVSVDVRKSA
jgi:transglutaminase-like putative cysteine protease